MSKQKGPAKKVKVVNYTLQKKAFDSTMESFRQMPRTCLRAVDYGNETGGSRNPARPTPQDFVIDVTRCLQYISRKKPGMLTNLLLAYAVFDSDDPVEIERHAQKVIGDGRHNLEQGLGNLFLTRKLYPARKYFDAMRHTATMNIAPEQFAPTVVPVLKKKSAAAINKFFEPKIEPVEPGQEAEEEGLRAEEKQNAELEVEAADTIFEGYAPVEIESSYEREAEAEIESAWQEDCDPFARQEHEMQFAD